MTNTEELERLIDESGLKKSYIAKKLQLSRQGFKKKCKNESLFNTFEINILCDLLNITKLSDKEKIFFVK